MEKNNGISDSRYKSRFFKKLAAWMGKHGAALTAVVLIAVSAILGCAEATIIYAAKGNEASNDYGTRGNTSSPSYIGGGGNNPTVYEPGVIGVSVVTYDLNEVSKGKTLEYGMDGKSKNKKAALVASTNDPEVVEAAKKNMQTLAKLPKTSRTITHTGSIKWEPRIRGKQSTSTVTPCIMRLRPTSSRCRTRMNMMTAPWYSSRVSSRPASTIPG